MGFIDSLKDRFSISNIIEEDETDDFDEQTDDEEIFDEEEEPRKGLFGFGKKKDEELSDEEIDEEPEQPATKFTSKKPSFTPAKAEVEFEEPEHKTFVPERAKKSYTPAPKQEYKPEPRQEAAPKAKQNGGKIVSMNKASGNISGAGKNMNELFMIKPKKEEDARAAVDALLQRKIVIINLEGLNLDIAQYVTDFVTGANYSIGGNFSTINSQVLVFTPSGVDLTGAFEENVYESNREF